MLEIDPVILQLRADVASYNATMQQTARRVDASLRLQEGSIVRLENRMTTGFERVGGSASRAQMLVGSSMSAIKGALAGVSAVALARSFLQISDEAKKLDATLKLATSGFGSFGQAQEDVRRIADETRSGLSETSSLYANFVRGAKELGGTQAEAARATETFSKTLKISGADANQAASATLQFGQALASGALRGDELNSILEASPRLARLLAEAMGQPIGQIKQLGEEGKLTSDKLLAALTNQKFTAGIDSEFRELPVTFDDAMTKVYNAALVTFGAFDRGGEFSTALANFVSDGSDGFADLEARAEQFGIEVRSTLAGLGDVFDPLLEAGVSVFDALGLKAFDLQGFIRQTLREFDGIANYLADTPGGRLVGATGSNALGRYDAGKKADQSRRQGEAAERRFRNLTGGYDVMGNPLPGTPSAGRGAAPKPVAASGGKKKTAAAPKSKLNPDAFAREEAALNDQILRLKAVEITNVDQKAQIELSRIEAARAAAVKEVAGDERYTAEQRAKVIALTETVAALEAAKVVYQRDLETARDALELRIAGLRNDEDLLRAQANLATSRQERRDIELRLLDLAYQQERADLEAIIASKEATDAQKQIAKMRLAMLGQLQGAEAEGVNRQNESPLERRRRDVRDTAANMGDAIENIELDAIDRLTDGLADAGTEFIKLGGIAGDVLNSIIRDMIRLAAQQAIFGSGGGGGGLVGGIGSFISSIGTSAGGGSTGTGVGFSEGGYTGDGPKGKVAGVVHKGEYVVPADAVRRVGVSSLEQLSSGNLAARSMVGATAIATPRQTIVNQSFNLDARYGITTPELLQHVNETARRESANAGSAAYAASQQSAPGTINKFSQLKG